MSNTVIEARGLTKRYDTAFAVRDVSFTVGAGEIFGLLGPNGAGKTTTILMMLGLTEVSGGTVEVLGFNPVREPLEVKRRVGYLPDSVGFYDHMTARENLLYTARLLAIPRSQTGRRSARTRSPSGSRTRARGPLARHGAGCEAAPAHVTSRASSRAGESEAQVRWRPGLP